MVERGLIPHPTPEWVGTTELREGDGAHTALRHRLAGAARTGDWPAVVALVTDHPPLANACEPRQASWAAPLHRAAEAGATVGIVRKLIALGAWRTLRNTADETALEIALRRGHGHLEAALRPRLKRHLAPAILAGLETNFHRVIRHRVADLVDGQELRLPALEPLLEYAGAEFWFAVPGFSGGFAYQLDVSPPPPKLVSHSWCRVVGGSEQHHECTVDGWHLVADGSD